MGKKNKKVSRGAQQRTRFNYLTKEYETVPGTKAGKRRTRLPYGHPLRTHDLAPKRKRREGKRDGDSTE